MDTLFNTTSDATQFKPAGAACFAASSSNGIGIFSSDCPVTVDMINALNLSDAFKAYFGAYCLNPPPDDGCPYGYCPNSDSSGIFVRVATYLTNLFVAVILFYDPKELQEAFWSQILTIYSLLLTCAWTTIRHHITRIHAILTIVMAGSPVTFYIFFYAVWSMFKDQHRMAITIGPGRRLARATVLLAMGFWGFGLVYILLPNHLSDFQQEACERNNHVVKDFYFLPLLIFRGLPLWAEILSLAPFVMTGIAWVIALFLGRNQIFPRGKPINLLYSLKMYRRTVKKEYRFIHFITMVVLPTGLWIILLELGVHFGAPHDNKLEASFGQVLAMFVAIPPLITTAKMGPHIKDWFLQLSWVRLCFSSCISTRKRKDSATPLPTTRSVSSFSSDNYMEKVSESKAIGTQSREDSFIDFSLNQVASPIRSRRLNDLITTAHP